MGYLTARDYDGHIQEVNWNQILQGKSRVQAQAENFAIAEITSNLVQKYDTASEFTETSVYKKSATYKGNSRVYLDGPAWSASASPYALDSIVSHTDGNVYIKNSTTAGYTNQAPTDATFWTLLGAQYAIYFVTLPFPAYNWALAYSAGSKVFYKGDVYTAMQNISEKNYILPGTNLSYWSAPESYTVTSVLVTDTTKWTYGDNRSILIYNWCTDIAIYNALQRISSRNIMQNRIDNYYAAIQGLKDAASGLRTIPDLALNQPTTTEGRTIKFNSNPKNLF